MADAQDLKLKLRRFLRVSPRFINHDRTIDLIE
jgi:hypothetical protein